MNAETRRRRRPSRHAPSKKTRQHRETVIEQSRARLEWPAFLDVLKVYASSAVARNAIPQLQPRTDRAEIQALLEETEEIRLLITERFSFRLVDLPDVPELLGRPENSGSRVLQGEELRSILFLLDRARGLGDFFRRRIDLPRLHERGARLLDLPELRERIELSIGIQGEVLSSASPELAQLRRDAAQVERELRDWMERRRQSSELKKVLQGDVVTLRHDRFVFAVKAEHRSKVPGIVHGESSSGATLFIEPQEIVLRGNRLSDLRSKERREITRILVELSREVHRERAVLEAMGRELVEVDLGLARARFGDAFGCHPAELAEGRHLSLSGARHPLLLWRDRDQDIQGFHDLGLERLRESIIPLEVELGPEYHQLVVTGPNTGGKTVVLKTTGLLALMTYCGLPIPADAGCKMPLFDSVLADIGDEQSLEQNLSTFSSHMTVTAGILDCASSRSLVLLDELGAGTDPLEGAALGEAILDRLYVRGTFTLVSTHLGSLKEFAFRRRKCENACMEFDAEALAPTYRLLSGLPGRSNALIIATRIGVPNEVVTKAQEILSGEERIDEQLLEGLERTRKDLERKRDAMEKERQNAQRLKENAAEEVESLRSMRSAIEYECERAEEERVRALVAEVGDALRRLGEPAGERRTIYQGLLDLLGRAHERTQLGERRLETARALRKGDFVFVPRLRAVSEVRKINKGKELLTVSINGVNTEVSFHDISYVLPPPGYESAWFHEL